MSFLASFALRSFALPSSCTSFPPWLQNHELARLPIPGWPLRTVKKMRFCKRTNAPADNLFQQSQNNMP
ncbi:MAG: hypothetical protein KGJ29_13960, partial [Hyphomicrobiales bacterium]|nr:hypothetical protein [Hyphomicrobiales bacterium]